LNLYLQQIAEQKLKAFSIGTMGKRPLSKKELEEQRKKEQEQAAAQVMWHISKFSSLSGILYR